jgi:predicted transcriptional regulator
VTKAFAKGLSVAEIVTLTGISRASVKRYRRELAID